MLVMPPTGQPAILDTPTRRHNIDYDDAATTAAFFH